MSIEILNISAISRKNRKGDLALRNRLNRKKNSLKTVTAQVEHNRLFLPNQDTERPKPVRIWSDT